MTKAAKLEFLREEKSSGPVLFCWGGRRKGAQRFGAGVFFIKPLHHKEPFGAIAPGFQAHILAGLFDCLTLFRLFLDVPGSSKCHV